jgi:hypothetical protein
MSSRNALAAVFAAAGLAVGFIAPASAAQDIVRWGSAGGWDIMIDPSLGNGCYIYTEYDAGTVVRLGFSPDDDEAYLMVGNAKWNSIQDGKDYDVQVRMDRDSPWYVTATGVQFDGLPFLMAETDDTDFLLDFAKKNSLAVSYGGQTVTSLSLSGTYAAVSEMINCQEQVNKRGGNSSADPFASSSSSNKSRSNSGDPFAH